MPILEAFAQLENLFELNPNSKKNYFSSTLFN